MWKNEAVFDQDFLKARLLILLFQSTDLET
jgi:hypothetical protein